MNFLSLKTANLHRSLVKIGIPLPLFLKFIQLEKVTVHRVQLLVTALWNLSARFPPLSFLCDT